MIKNETNDDYQIIVTVDDKYLEGEIRCSKKPKYNFKIEEKMIIRNKAIMMHSPLISYENEK